tara:strand:- start:1565 stop:1807 length:243 start_codon:yes stop_codon:yes gene_type:complete
MTPFYNFGDCELTVVNIERTRYNKKQDKHIELKKPIETRQTTKKVSLYDLFDLVTEIQYHSKDLGYQDELEVKFRLTKEY